MIWRCPLPTVGCRLVAPCLDATPLALLLFSYAFSLAVSPQRIGPVTCMAFHPTEMLLAAGATGARFDLSCQCKHACNSACTASIGHPFPPRSLFIGHLDQHVCGAPQIISSRCTDLHTRPRDANSYSRTLYHYAVQPELIQALVCWVKIKPHNLQLEE